MTLDGKMLQLRADCCFSVSVSAVIFCNMNHLCILTWYNRSWSQQLRIATWTPKSICLTFGKRVLSYVLTRCQWFRTFDPPDNNLFWPSHPSLGGYVFFFLTILTACWFAKCLVARCLLRSCNAKRCFQKEVLAGAGMSFCLCSMLQ